MRHYQATSIRRSNLESLQRYVTSGTHGNGFWFPIAMVGCAVGVPAGWRPGTWRKLIKVRKRYRNDDYMGKRSERSVTKEPTTSSPTNLLTLGCRRIATSVYLETFREQSWLAQGRVESSWVELKIARFNLKRYRFYCYDTVCLLPLLLQFG